MDLIEDADGNYTHRLHDNISSSYHQVQITLDIFNNIFILFLSLPPLMTLLCIKALHTPDNMILCGTLVSGLLASLWHLPMTMMANTMSTSLLILGQRESCMTLHASKIMSENSLFTSALVMSINNCFVVYNYLWYEQNASNRIAIFVVVSIFGLNAIQVIVFYFLMDFDEQVEYLPERCSYDHNFCQLKSYEHIKAFLELMIILTLNVYMCCTTYTQNRNVRRMSEHIETAFTLRYDLLKHTSFTIIVFCIFWIPTVSANFIGIFYDAGLTHVYWDVARILRHTSLFYFPTSYCFQRELYRRGFSLVLSTPCWSWNKTLRKLSAATAQENLEFYLHRNAVTLNESSLNTADSYLATDTYAEGSRTTFHTDSTFVRKYQWSNIFSYETRPGILAPRDTNKPRLVQAETMVITKHGKTIGFETNLG